MNYNSIQSSFSSLGCHSVRNKKKKYFLSLVSTQICDKEWHYYVINVEFPAVTLFVDGVTYDPYLVTDDWPIHPSQIDVQLTVGACWQGEGNEDIQVYDEPQKRIASISFYKKNSKFLYIVLFSVFNTHLY